MFPSCGVSAMLKARHKTSNQSAVAKHGLAILKTSHSACTPKLPEISEQQQYTQILIFGFCVLLRVSSWLLEVQSLPTTF
jgi:hypothetical protein